MEGSIGDRGTGQTHRLQHRLGCQHAGAAHLDHDILQHRGLLLGGILVCHSPFGAFGGAPNHIALGKVIQLDHGAVYVEGIFHSLVAHPGDFDQNVSSFAQPAIWDHLEVLGGQIIYGLGMAGEGPALGQLQVKHGDVQPALGGHLGVQLPQRAGCGVAGIRHQRLALDLPPGVDLLKDLTGHVDLTPHDEPGQLLRQGHGDGPNGAEVLRHVLPYPAVSSGGAADEDTVPVLQGYGQAIHLGLHAIHGLRQSGLHAFQELPDLPIVEHVLQTLQRHGMFYRGELGQRRPSHPLGGRIRRDLLRVLPLQILQAAQQAVIFKVRDDRRILYVVAIAVCVQLVPELLHFLFVVHVITRCS